MSDAPDPDDAEFVEVDEDDDSDGGSFADTTSVFERDTFEDARSIFSTPRTPPVNSTNPTVTAAQEEARYETAHPREKRLLVCQITKSGKPVVAQYLGRKRLEKWRTPRPEELQFLQSQGKLVKGGLADVPVALVAEKSAPSGIGTVVKIGIGVGLAYGAYRLYKSIQTDEHDVETVEV